MRIDDSSLITFISTSLLIGDIKSFEFKISDKAEFIITAKFSNDFHVNGFSKKNFILAINNLLKNIKFKEQTWQILNSVVK